MNSLQSFGYLILIVLIELFLEFMKNFWDFILSYFEEVID